MERPKDSGFSPSVLERGLHHEKAWRQLSEG